MTRLKYTHNILGVLPVSLQEIVAIATRLFGPSRGRWKAKEEGGILTIISFARSKDRQTFVALLEAVLDAADEPGRG